MAEKTLILIIALLFTLPAWCSSNRSYEQQYRQELESSLRPDPGKKRYDFFRAAASGDISAVNGYIRMGLDLNDQLGRLDKTPLIIASENGHLDIVSALIQAGADLEVTDSEFGRTALMWARHNGHDPVVQALIQAGAEDRPEPVFTKRRIRDLLFFPTFFLVAFASLLYSMVFIPVLRFKGVKLGLFDRDSLKYAEFYKAVRQKENKSYSLYSVFYFSIITGFLGFAGIFLSLLDIRLAIPAFVMLFVLHKIFHSS